jgi:hypothetical protein
MDALSTSDDSRRYLFCVLMISEYVIDALNLMLTRKFQLDLEIQMN